MRIGLFLHEFDPTFPLNELLLTLGNEVVGYSSPIPLDVFPKSMDFQPHPMELLLGCDLAIMFSAHEFFWEIPRAALRRGINVFFADLTIHNLPKLIETKHLAEEIGVRIGFGFSGKDIPVFKNNKGSNGGAFFSQFNRNLKRGSDFEKFKRTVIYDLATQIRLKNNVVKRLRSLALPINDGEYNLLHLSIELINGSMLSYTADRMANSDSLRIIIHGNGLDEPAKIDFNLSPFSDSVALVDSPYSPMEFINSIKNGTEIDFSIDQAIETMKIFEEINQKHSRFS